MPHSYIIEHAGGTAEISGYVLILPFRLNARALLQPTTGEAKLIVQLHWVKPERRDFPSYTAGLPERSRIKIIDPTRITIVEISDVMAKTIVSNQSVDVATTLWVLNAMKESTVKFDPQPQYHEEVEGGGYSPWKGTLRGGAGGKNGINVTYAECLYQADANRTLREFAAIGPANADGAGSFFNLIAGGTPNQSLPSVQFTDVRRGTKIELFGTGAGEAQMAEASGAVFAFNGTFKQCKPADLSRLVRDLSIPRITDGISTQAATWQEQEWRENTIFRDLAQSIEATSKRTSANQASFDTADSDFEGLVLKGLRPRDGKAATLL